MKIAVVGGGITGLAAAYEAERAGADVVLFEASDRLGGKVHTSPFAGRPVDEGADAFLARVPAGVELCRELGLEGDLVAPATGAAYVWARGELRRLPAGLVLGVPTDLDALAGSGIVSPAAVERAAADLTRTHDDGPAGDESVGALVRRRLGDEIHELLVDPLVGSINAGDTDHLSVRATAPVIAAAAAASPSLIAGARAPRDAPPGPVFYSPRGGMGTLVDRLAAGLRGDIRCGAAVDAIAPGYRVGGVAVDAVVVTVPAPAAAALITDLAPAAAVALARVEYASVVLVTLAYDREDPLDGSGFLVPRGAGLTLTACSWTSSKWAHLGGDGLILRASAGRSGDDRAARMSDGEIVTRVRADLATTMGLHGPPAEVRVSRWPASFPQYAPGHLDRVDAIDAAMPPGLAVAGAALRGLGVPACIAQGRAAARRVYGP